MKSLIRSVAGVRGIWGETLFLDDVIAYSSAFGTYLKSGKVIIGRDTRVTGEMVNHAAVAGLISAGCTVTDIGVVPTPTCQLMVEVSDAVGGIVITASHNPVEWNGLKFIDQDGHFLAQNAFNELIELIDNHKIKPVKIQDLKVSKQGEVYNQQAIQTHIDKICEHINGDKIRGKKYKVALDATNGAGSRMILPFLEHLGCQVFTLYCEENGLFPRGPEPMPENIGDLCRFVVEKKADIGFAVDPDADRLSIVTEKGDALGEELTLPLVANHLLPSKGGVVVTNLSTSMAIDFVAERHQTYVIRTKIGEAHVVSGMKQNTCHVGGEGNGGIIVPDIHYARDTGVGIGFVLESMVMSDSTISALAGIIPRYVMVKKKIDCPLNKIPEVLSKLQYAHPDARIDNNDGIKLIWDEAWLHVRKSGTEGLLRIFAEAKSADRADQMIQEGMELIKSVISTKKFV